MSRTILFAGPSLAGLTDGLPDHISLRAPVQQGDIYLAALESPRAIAVVDGFFEGMPAVWHKEILWALTRSIPVLGAASMGALRAAEMDVFGMVGVGAIYDGYRDGALEDDDEVALLHGPAEMGYPALSLAMVNVRATLAAAETAGVVDGDGAARLVARAKAQFYKTRTWASILADESATLRDWVLKNEVDQKQEDAALLMKHLAAGAFEDPQPDVHFEESALWHEATKIWRQRASVARERHQWGDRVRAGASLFDE
ncbi:TfuA-like protein [Roseobacter sinensis]|uniref:TfuA domain-containing protein n=1 Tax=Roseobacter sinensis TaxID=2931391 RepID=A0ABT3BGY2_9RHOB|nr:TfuA domain-containing protein [Roseobacter sp. WL0113]MCV3272839.1 TfuA domain-containing protein [Roseobacter sp. WL0113]